VGELVGMIIGYVVRIRDGSKSIFGNNPNLDYVNKI
jgi:hypothetical protein